MTSHFSKLVEPETEEYQETGIFSIRGNLDGEKSQDYAEREQFIGLQIGKEEFLLPIKAVSEIVMLKPITYVPHGPRFIDGVFNLRGTIIPAINLRKMMGIGRGEVTSSARIIIVKETIHEPQELTVGLLVDGISVVASLLPSQIENQVLATKSFGAELINGISKFQNKVVGILDIPKVISSAGGGKINTDDSEIASN